MRVYSRVTALVLASALPMASAYAATSTANMNVGIQITAACNIGVTDINFGAQAATVLAAALTSTPPMGGLFSYTCSPGTAPPALTASNGANYSGTTNQMLGTTGALIPYSLTMPAIPAFTGLASTAQITATIPAQATLPAVDTYTDAVVLTLTY